MRKTLRSESGQASLMIGMMMMTFILLFAFVVNTGMLVNAKINLQNAADLAAYAGASVQARQLDDISYLNYEMRRQYKKFLFRYYVIGNMASAYFPRPGNAAGASVVPKWGPGPNSPFNYGVPAVCMVFSSTGPLDNYCQVGVLPGIQIPNSNPLDQINQTLIGQLDQIEQLREGNCGKIASANSVMLMLWLFNTSPDLSSLLNAAAVNDANLQAIMRISESAAAGLGLVPREVILKERMKTLQDYVNEPAQTHVTKAGVDAFQQSQDPPSEERTIQAFLSAYYTLGNHTFNNDGQVSMDELLPGNSTAAKLLSLLPIEQSFDTFAVQFQLQGGQNGSNDCVPYLVPITARNVPLGVYKDPSVMTFYAIRLTATAQVLFSPFGPMTLTAYAAARPFGSRIGPPSGTYTDFTTNSLSPQAPIDPFDPALKSQMVGAVPDLPFSDTDLPLAPGKGWDNGQTLQSLYSQFFPGGAAPVGSALNGANFDTALQAGMVPNPIEGSRYNILPDGNQDPFVTAFDSMHQMSFWAPVISPTKIQNLQSVLQSDIQGIFQKAPTNGIPTGGNSAQSLATALGTDILNYVNAMEKGQGEILAGQPDAAGRCNPDSCVQEGLNIAHIQDPWVQSDGTPIQLSSTIMIQPGDTSAYKTSYVTTLDPKWQAAGRVGYSVKFVSFESLLKGTDTTGSGTTYTFQPPDTQSQLDLKQIQH